MTDVINEDSLQEKANKYVQLRDKRSELKRIYEEADSKLKVAMADLEQELLQAIQDIGANSVRLNGLTVIRSTQTRYNVDDWEAFTNFVLENGAVDLLQRRIANTAAKAYEESGTLPAGVSKHSQYKINVRKA